MSHTFALVVSDRRHGAPIVSVKAQGDKEHCGRCYDIHYAKDLNKRVKMARVEVYGFMRWPVDDNHCYECWPDPVYER